VARAARRRLELVAVADLGGGGWAELLHDGDRWRVLAQHPDASVDGVEWLVSVAYGPFRLRSEAEDRIASLVEVAA